MIINTERFLQREQPFWQKLETELSRRENDRLFRPTVDDSLQLFELYQRCLADLGRLQSSGQTELTQYLESIVARAYAQIHSHPEKTRFQLRNWFLQVLPQTFRRRFPAFLLALAMTLAGTVTGSGLMAIDPDAKQIIMPFQGLLSDPAKRVQQEERSRSSRVNSVQASFSAELMTHNIQVAFFSLACGMTFGIGTIIVLFANGIMLGAVIFDYLHAGQLQFLMGWLMPHGVIEIPAILVASQAGFVLAGALIGRRKQTPREQTWQAIAHDVTTLAAATALMLVWAGVTEAFISQYHQPVLPYAIKIAFGAVELMALIFYFTTAGSRSA